MKNIMKVSAAFGMIVAAGVFTGNEVVAKSHDQGLGSANRGDVGATVGAAHTLGSALGNRPDDKGPVNSPAVNKAGSKSGYGKQVKK